LSAPAAAVKYTAQTMAETPDPSRCPLCGAPNGCAMARGDDAAACWCMSAAIAPELLAQVPEAARDAACVCAACARRDATRVPPRPLRTVTR
jgi:hypothetical protein